MTEYFLKKIEEKIEKGNKQILSEFEMHTKALLEEFQKRLGTIGEQYTSLQEKVDKVPILQEKIDKIAIKTDATFEEVGKLKVKATAIEDTLKIIQDDVQIIKGSLKRKVDIDEFEALEKRVILLERKLKGA